MLNDTVKALSQLTENLPVRTNLGLRHVLWRLVSGALLASCGALLPALKSIGLSDAETRRAWRAFRSGQWNIRDLVRVWRVYVKEQNGWVVHQIEGYVPMTADLTAFWQPTLKNCPSKHSEPFSVTLTSVTLKTSRLSLSDVVRGKAGFRAVTNHSAQVRVYSTPRGQSSHALHPMNWQSASVLPGLKTSA